MRYLILLVSFWGCCGGGVERIASFRFSEYERNLIPYTSDAFEEYISENNTIYESQVYKLRTNQFAATEACEETSYEHATATLDFEDLSYVIDITLENRVGTDFYLRASFYDITGEITEDDFLFIKDKVEGSPLEDYPRDVVINGETYSNVFVFENPRADGKTRMVLYSSVNGIEYIEWEGNNYLMLLN